MSLRSLTRWSWIPLVPLLASACESRDLVCEQASYFQALKPDDVITGAIAPFSIDRLGHEVPSTDLEQTPVALRLKSGDRVIVDWASRGRFYGHTDLDFSPADGLARNVDPNLPNDVYPMTRFPDHARERVRLGFRSRKCAVPGTCTGDERLFLVAEMSCHRE